MHCLCGAAVALRSILTSRARSCARAGGPDNITTLQSCLELSLQLYNSKIALPNERVRNFAHTDGDHLAKGFGATPAPQCVAMISPSESNGTDIFRFRFYDLSTKPVHIIEHTRMPTSNARVHTLMYVTLQAQAALGRLRSAARSTSPVVTLPIKGGKARGCLPRFVNFGKSPATTLPVVKEPTFVFFDAPTAHEITQWGIQLTAAQLRGDEAVPLDFTRRAEFPMFVSRRLHGEPHQSPEEVAMAHATGTPPMKWAHVYTGNSQETKTARHLESLVPPVQVNLATLLAKCLLQGTDADGVHAFAAFPQAISWLLVAAASGGGFDAIVDAELEQARTHARCTRHESPLPPPSPPTHSPPPLPSPPSLPLSPSQVALHRLQLHPTLAALKTRLETQAQLDDEGSLAGGLLRSRFLSEGGLTTYSILGPNPVVAIAIAARRALKEIKWVASPEEKQEEAEAAKRVQLVLARKEVEELGYAQALILDDPIDGIGGDGSMGQCFFCHGHGENCETEVLCCDGCICVFHRRCLSQRGVQVDEGEPLLRCPVCVARESAERDPSKQSVLALTARGTMPRVVFEAVPLLVPPSSAQSSAQPARPALNARRTRPRLNEAAAAAAPGTSPPPPPPAQPPPPAGRKRPRSRPDEVAAAAGAGTSLRGEGPRRERVSAPVLSDSTPRATSDSAFTLATLTPEPTTVSSKPQPLNPTLTNPEPSPQPTAKLNS